MMHRLAGADYYQKCENQDFRSNCLHSIEQILEKAHLSTHSTLSKGLELDKVVAHVYCKHTFHLKVIQFV